jgi:hypothetical protein
MKTGRRVARSPAPATGALRQRMMDETRVAIVEHAPPADRLGVSARTMATDRDEVSRIKEASAMWDRGLPVCRGSD